MFSWIRIGASSIGGGAVSGWVFWVGAGRCGGGGRRRVLAMVLQEGGDRVVGAGAEHQRASAGVLDPGGAIALDQPEDSDAGAEPLLRMWPRAQDHIGQDDGVVADRGGLSADALMRPVA